MKESPASQPSGPRPERRDIFEKCWKFNRARALQEAGLYVYFETFGGREAAAQARSCLATENPDVRLERLP